MITLYDALPDSLNISGKAFAIDTHFSTWIRFESLAAEGLETGEFLATAIWMVFKGTKADESLPRITADNFEEIFTQLLWFYSCGEQTELKEKDPYAEKQPTPFSFDKDAKLFIAAFQQAYNINLLESDMHWWRFRALIDGLPSDTLLSKVIEYRTADLTDMPESYKKHYIKVRRKLSLDSDYDKEVDIMDRVEAAKRRLEKYEMEKEQGKDPEREFWERRKNDVRKRLDG